ncbi:hypothetical protein [Olleya sp. HaHaR_3_96]|uniref:hypothetical protein n=1 Tax=Olleya sp. HaHaR_3_96 TaxID=2745560 RepID=UPI001C4E6941|nr:hypothetical protein [Olleya sp. HaHaR_3_96]QXP61561.1 hypothetical protein H0I26_08005 [Olleya sp. HaHaR_3_96]
MNYLEILKDINYFSFIAAFAKWILLFLVISIIILIVCKRTGLFKRRTKTASYLVKIYYILIPIYFVVFAIKYAAIKNTQIEINNSIDVNKQLISAFTFHFINTIVSDSLLSQDNSAKDIVNHYLDKYTHSIDTMPDNKIFSVFQSFFIKTKRKVEYSFLMQILESKIIEKSVKSIGISQNSGQALYQTDFNQLFHEGALVDIFKTEMNSYFRTYFKFSFLFFLLGLLIPTIEIILAKKLQY